MRIIQNAGGLSAIVAFLRDRVRLDANGSDAMEGSCRIIARRESVASGLVVRSTLRSVSSGEKQRGLSGYRFALSVEASSPSCRGGRLAWKTYLIPDRRNRPDETRSARSCGASWRAVWSSPTIDVKTACSMSPRAMPTPGSPDDRCCRGAGHQDGTIKWVRQLLANDAWNMACGSTDANCPENEGPDADFGQPPSW